MLNVYKVLSENISNAVSINGNEQPYVAIMTLTHMLCIISCASSDTVNVSVCDSPGVDKMEKSGTTSSKSVHN